MSHSKRRRNPNDQPPHKVHSAHAESHGTAPSQLLPPQPRNGEAAAFLATLAQITATVLAVFVTALAAYYVFLQEHETAFEERSAQDRVEISDTLRRVWDVWPPSITDDPFALSIEAPYRKRVHKGGIALVEGALSDLQLEDSPLKEVVVTLYGSRAAGSAWRGPAFLWAFDSALQAMTGDDKQQKHWNPNGAGDPCNIKADKTACFGPGTSLFPTARNGTGFEQWRRTFESLYAKMLSLRGVTVFDGGSYFPNGFDDRRYADKNTVASMERVLSLLAEVNAKLGDIDKLAESAERYALPNRLRLLPLTATALSVAAISGLLVPLVLLALGRKVRASHSFALLGATLVLCIGGFLAFGYDVVGGGRSTDDYVTKRWVIPMDALLEEHEQERRRGELLSVDRLGDARADADGIGVPAPTLARLDRYIEATRDYNEKTRRLGETIVDAMRSILEPAGMLGNQASGYFSIMAPAMVLDDAAVNDYVNGFLRSKVGFLDIESGEEKLEVAVTDGNKKKIDVLRSAMRGGKAAALRSGAAASFEEARRRADDESRRLSSALRAR